ncbi:autotransporter domain-containing protein [Arcobacter sp.]|uniref:autotransporter family protein n=1 Tax=unclassified Arcobacter TaxID=2593671 RepID=UPI003B001C5E
MKNSIDYKSRFRILKGGKVSLVVSALLLGSVISLSDAATISTAVTTTQSHDLSTTDIDITSTGSITIVDDTEFAVIANDSGQINEEHFISNAGIIEIERDLNVTAIQVDGLNEGNILNSGRITSKSRNGDAMGIYTNENSDTIENSGTITATGKHASGIFNMDNNYGSIVNSGTITATGKYASGISNMDNYYGNIVNSGTITATGTYAAGIYNTNNYHGSIENTGSITVDTSSRNVGIESDSKYESSIINSGTIMATINGKADANAYSLSLFDSTSTSTALNDTSGKLYGNIQIEGLKFTNKGLISLPYNATGTDSAKISDFTQTQTGKLQIGLFTDGSTTTYSQLTTDDATFEDGSTIDVNVLSSSTNSELLIGQKLDDIVTASNSLTLDGTLNVTDNSALLNFEYVKDGETLDLNVVEGTTLLNATSTGGGNSTTKAAASALQTIQNAGTNTAMSQVFTALNKLSTNKEVANAVESTTPQNAGSTVGAVGQISNTITGIVDQRQNITMGGLNSGDEMFSQKSVWIKPFGSFGSQNDKDGLNGFDLKAHGIGVGIDGEYKPNQTLGFGFFYTNANVDVNNVSQKSDLDVFTTLVYGNVPVLDEKTNLLYQVGYSWQKTNGERSIFTGDTARSKYTSKTASLDLKLVRDYKINDDLLLQPMISTTYRHFTNPSYSETGAGALNLAIKKFTSTELLLGVGTLANYKLNNDSRIVGSVNIGYNLHDRQQSVTASYQGATGVSFDTTGIDNGRWSYDLGVGYEMDINDTSNINFSYNRQGQGSDFTNNTFSAKYVLKF